MTEFFLALLLILCLRQVPHHLSLALALNERGELEGGQESGVMGRWWGRGRVKLERERKREEKRQWG